MIRYYTYYSCGGYKDIYIGSDQDSSEVSYFIPLLNVWKKNNKPENADKIARAESVQHVELISKSNSAGFPSECTLMFSHGGYKAILRTLRDGRQCLSIRDIANGAKDEEGRDIPFNFLFLADGLDSIDQLDALAISYLTKSNEIDGLISSAISYDPVINGVRFDLEKLNQLLIKQQGLSNKLSHKAGVVDYLKIGSRNQYKLSFTEQALEADNVNSLWDDNGLFYGNIAYAAESPELVDEEDSTHERNQVKTESLHITDVPPEAESKDLESNNIDVQISDNPMEKEDNFPDNFQKDEPLSKSDMGSLIHQLEKRISSLATSESIDNLQALLKRISNESNSILSKIQEQLNESAESPVTHPITLIDRPNEHALLNKPIIIAVGCLIVGFILGALIF